MKIFKNILIATYGSELADNAVSHGLKLSRELNATVIFVIITELWSTLGMATETYTWKINPTESNEEIQATLANKVLADAANKANKLGINCEAIRKQDHPAEGIIDVANTKRCDLIIMASHGRRGINKVLLGSVANEVVTHSPVPVLVIR